MTVDIEYAKEHLEELMDAVDNGEEVLIMRPGKPTLALIKAKDNSA